MEKKCAIQFVAKSYKQKNNGFGYERKNFFSKCVNDASNPKNYVNLSSLLYPTLPNIYFLLFELKSIFKKFKL